MWLCVGQRLANTHNWDEYETKFCSAVYICIAQWACVGSECTRESETHSCVGRTYKNKSETHKRERNGVRQRMYVWGRHLVDIPPS